VTLAEFRAKHAEPVTRRDGLDALGDLRASTATFATIDDHELRNDAAGGARVPWWDPRGGPLNATPFYEGALRAFTEWNPIRAETWSGTGDALVDGRPRLYRHRRFGDDAALFVLDTRSFRSPPVARPGRDAEGAARFREEAAAPGRTLLGVPQRDRFEADLRAAEAAGVTWKFVVVPTPIQNLGPGRDRYEGYAHERGRLLALVRDEGIRNVVFLTGDIHGMCVNDLEFRRSSPRGERERVDAFEVATLPVGCHGVLGRYTVRSAALSGAERAAYEAADMDGKDDVAALVIDARLAREGMNPTGLADARLGARLLEGRWVRGHAYGWCEFEVDAATAVLTVTAWGLEDSAGRSPDRRPRVLSRFTVPPRR
jgi:3-phytase/alkaline phosphatase D